MIGNIVLWTWLSGILTTWLAGARWIGRNFPRLVAESKAAYAEHWTYLKTIGWQRPTAAAAGIFIAGWAWPLAAPVIACFFSGRHHEESRQKMAKLLEDAEAEIARIKKQEGWA